MYTCVILVFQKTIVNALHLKTKLICYLHSNINNTYANVKLFSASYVFFIHIILRRLSYKYMQFTQQHLYYICIFVCTLLDLCVLINMILCRLQYKFMCATLLTLFTASYVLFFIDLILCTLSYKSMQVTWDYLMYRILWCVSY